MILPLPLPLPLPFSRPVAAYPGESPALWNGYSSCSTAAVVYCSSKGKVRRCRVKLTIVNHEVQYILIVLMVASPPYE